MVRRGVKIFSCGHPPIGGVTLSTSSTVVTPAAIFMHPGNAQRFHAFAVRLLAYQRSIGFSRDQRPLRRRHTQDLVDADPARVAGHPALEAALGVVHLLRFFGLPRRDQHGPGAVVDVGSFAAERTERAYQSLRHHRQNRGVKQIRRHADVEQAGERRGRIVGVQRGKHQMAGERGLDRHFRGFHVADLADHDDVGVLAHERAHAGGKVESDGVLHLHLVELWLDHFDRILDGADIDLRGSDLLQSRIQRGGLAGAGRSGYQHDTVRTRCRPGSSVPDPRPRSPGP